MQMSDLILILCKGTNDFLEKQRILSLVQHFTMMRNQINDILMVPVLEQLRFLVGILVFFLAGWPSISVS